jgi:hypothetical protein
MSRKAGRELVVGQRLEGGVGAPPDPLHRRPQARRADLRDLLQGLEREAGGLERGHGRLDGREPRGDPAGAREEPEQGDPLVAAGKRAADQHRAARPHDPAKLAGAAGQVAEVVDDR